ncbi:MAG: hypothetical protein M5U34_08740 [Chloroflexi bacterium]|nr:hypothetical protein [Chloroflexota bacterium]
MPRLSASRKYLNKKARKHSTGYPIGTVAYYGPTDQFASKVAVSIISENNKQLALERWYASTEDVRLDEEICQQIATFLQEYDVYRVAMPDRIIGCPHEEGIDYPLGEVCPQCPFWIGIDRWTGERLP